MLCLQRSIRGAAAIFLAALLWGTTGTAAAFAPELSPLAIGSLAMGIGGVLQGLMVTNMIISQRHLLIEQWRLLLAGAITVAIYPLAFYASMRYAGVTVGTIISIGSAPLLSALIEYYFDGTRISRQWLCGALIGVSGMIVLCLLKNTDSLYQQDRVILGIVLGLLAGATYAFYSWSARRLMQSGIAPRVAMGATFGSGGLLLFPVFFITATAFFDHLTHVVVGLYMGLAPMFVGYLCYGYGLARLSASMATTITLCEPVVAAILASLVIGERLQLPAWIGAGMVVLSLFVIAFPVRRFSEHEQKQGETA
ncbi:MAG: hypothetical protein XXXJIFNMEKO3_01226 [Candidatus Erwinia impunctatus]|nr:hypothetical protein XXXJIFNMEKO_01226 [Culicoides impunctatus]